MKMKSYGYPILIKDYTMTYYCINDGVIDIMIVAFALEGLKTNTEENKLP